MATGRVSEVVFCKKRGWDNLVALAERLRGKYHTAIIYGRKPHPGGGWQPAKELRKYVGQHIVEDTPINWAQINTQKKYSFSLKEHGFELVPMG